MYRENAPVRGARAALLAAMHGDEAEGGPVAAETALSVIVHHLRRKLGGKATIVAVRGAGYRLTVPAPEQVPVDARDLVPREGSDLGAPLPRRRAEG